MVAGLGIDMAEVERIAAGIERQQGFKEMIFSANEIAYCDKQKNAFEHYAARFAAKEAFFKALGTGWETGTAFNEIEVLHDDNGKPELYFLGETATYVASLNILKISVSLSHVKNMAAAVVIIEK